MVEIAALPLARAAAGPLARAAAGPLPPNVQCDEYQKK